jgi:PAS domain S-box-containing protein
MQRLLRLIYVDVPALRPGTLGGYALAFVCAVISTIVRLEVDPYVNGFPLITFWPAIIITALISGFGAGLFCIMLSAAAADFFVLPPRLTFYAENPAHVTEFLLFFLVAGLCVIIITRMRDAIEREEAERAWRANKDQLQLALDTAQLGSWQYDPRRRVATGDARFKEIFDITADEIPIEDIKKLVHPADAERFWAERAAASDPANPRRPPHEYRVRRRNGEVRWIEVRWLAYYDGDRREREAASIIGTVHDITERKEREEREHLLMREINHRTKNMLSVVDAIAHQTATRTPEAFIERFSERIQALAANQDLLIRNEWHGVEAGDLVRAQLAPFAGLIGSRVIIRGPKLRLNAASAQAIGLALHELATNTGKYGALSNDTGRLNIGWSVSRDSFIMSWTEREGPAVSAPNQRGFGTTVMERMAESSLGGTVELDYDPSGLTWRLACPAENVLEPGNRDRVAS